MQEDIESFDSFDENMETLLSHDGGDGRDIYGTIKQSPTEHQKESAKGKPYISSVFTYCCIWFFLC